MDPQDLLNCWGNQLRVVHTSDSLVQWFQLHPVTVMGCPELGVTAWQAFIQFGRLFKVLLACGFFLYWIQYSWPASVVFPFFCFLPHEGIFYLCSLTEKLFWRNLALTNCTGRSCLENLLLLSLLADSSGTEGNMQLEYVGIWYCCEMQTPLQSTDGAWDVLYLGWISWM